MAIVIKALNCLTVLLAAILIAGLYDVGHFGLGSALSSLAIGIIPLFAILSIVPIFLGAGGKGGDLDGEGIEEKIGEVQTKLTNRINSLRSDIDGLSGQDNEALQEENRLLKEQIEAFQQAERDNTLKESEQLRSRNEELENQIKQWAIKTVGDAVTDQDGDQAQAA